MKLYRYIPQPVEAVQLTDDSPEEVVRIINWITNNRASVKAVINDAQDFTGLLIANAKDKLEDVAIGDFIVKSRFGNFFAMSEEDFMMNYEPLDKTNL